MGFMVHYLSFICCRKITQVFEFILLRRSENLPHLFYEKTPEELFCLSCQLNFQAREIIIFCTEHLVRANRG